ncbi:TetR/AcrR family transcriptional regulator [Methylophaga lonarensis]|uniref:TetR/AcrR family transcriptional regulator n=1 Tax=Methylophaga lonarensis TaxID=999151 RepID=UPI003D2A834C
MKPATKENATRDHIIATGQKIISHKGFSAVGLTEILKDAGTPKGSFYHYFASKDAFGEEMLKSYFKEYHAEMDALFAKQGLSGAQRLLQYFSDWQKNQSIDDCQGRCLAVKLGAEVSDISTPMRLALKEGTEGIISRLKDLIDAGVEDKSLSVDRSSKDVAASLYYLWVGASVMTKIARTQDAFEATLQSTKQMLGIK